MVVALWLHKSWIDKETMVLFPKNRKDFPTSEQPWIGLIFQHPGAIRKTKAQQQNLSMTAMEDKM